MIKKLLVSLVLSLALSTAANAATVTLVAPASVQAGATFQVDIFWAGPQSFMAGGVQVVFDPALASATADDFTFNLAIDPVLSCPGSPVCPVDPPGVITLVWAHFTSGLIPPGGPLMGSILFTAIGDPGSVIDLTLVDFSDLTGGWFDVSFSLIPVPDLVGAQVNIIPLPAATWLMIGGLATLLGFRRK